MFHSEFCILKFSLKISFTNFSRILSISNIEISFYWGVFQHLKYMIKFFPEIELTDFQESYLRSSFVQIKIEGQKMVFEISIFGIKFLMSHFGTIFEHDVIKLVVIKYFVYSYLSNRTFKLFRLNRGLWF